MDEDPHLPFLGILADEEGLSLIHSQQRWRAASSRAAERAHSAAVWASAPAQLRGSAPGPREQLQTMWTQKTVAAFPERFSDKSW